MNFISGLANCHLPGLYSLVLSERTSPSQGMRRVFYCGPDCKMDLWDGADFRLKPHNHRQNIKLTLLCGHAENVSVKTGYGELRLFCYRFGSALLDGYFTLERLTFADAHMTSTPLTDKPLALHWSEVHTVVAQPHSAWLVEEGELATPGVERLWSVSNHLELWTEGLYHPMSPEELKVVGRRLEHLIVQSGQTKEKAHGSKTD